MGLKRKVAGLAVVSCASFALAALCFAVGFDARAQKDEAAAPVTTKVTQSVDGISSLDVETSSADVRVELYDGDAIEAEMTAVDGASGKLEIASRVEDGTLVLDARGKVARNVRWSLADVLHFNIDVESDEATLHLRVPSGLRPSLRIATKSGDVSLPTMTLTKAELETTSGDVDLGRVTAQALRVETTSGDLAARSGVDAAGIRVETTSGGIAIAKAKGALDLRTLSGDVDLTAATGSVVVATTSGDVRVDLDGIDGEIQGRSVSGDIRMRLHKDAPVSVEMTTRSGEIHSDFGHGSDDGRLSYAPADARHRISLDSTSGDLSLTTL